MATTYDSVYNIFLSEIADSSILDYAVNDRTAILLGLLKKAITRFKACQTDLSDRNETNLQFNQTLTDEEVLILATIMRKHWLNDKIYNLDLLQQRMSTKDWKLTSQAEHLLRLTTLKNELEKEISRMIVDYTTYAYSLED